MRKYIFIGLGILALLIIGALIAPSLIPSSVYKEKIQTQLTQELGRDVKMEGDVSLSIFPVIKAKTGRVTIANAPGFEDSVFAAMDGLNARIKLWPLLSKRVEIASFKLISPEIHLQKNASGGVNWALGKEDEQQPAEDEAGPFKRDGRYANLDPKIGKFTLQNGQITYKDDTKNISHSFTKANLDFSVPSLSDPVSVKGDVVVNNDPVTLNLHLDTPRKFLDGKNTPSRIDIKTDYASINADGHFLESPDMTFVFEVMGDVSDLTQLKAYLPDNYPVHEIIKTAQIKGRYGYDGKTLSAENADLTAKGPLLDANYKGSAWLNDAPKFDGQVAVKMSEVPKLARLMKQDIKGVELLSTVDLKAKMKALDKGFSASDIQAHVTGDGLDANINGNGTFTDKPKFDGRVSADVRGLSAKAAMFEQKIDGLDEITDLRLNGDISIADDTYNITNMATELSGNNVKLKYQGSAAMAGKATRAKGSFQGEVTSVPALITAFKIDMPQAGALGRAWAEGNIDMAGDDLTLNLSDARTEGENLTASYKGDVIKRGEAINLTGDFNAAVPSLSAFAKAAKTDIPYADSIGAINAKGHISGTPKALNVSQIDAKLSDGALNGQFTGDAVVSDKFDLKGKLDTQIPSVRNLARITGSNLPPDTDSGKIFETASLSGNVSGNPEEINFTDARLNFDKISGQGTVNVDMRGSKPVMNGRLDLSELDLRPYMASYAAVNTNEGVQPWSTEPYNFEALKSIDGEFKISTPKIQMTNMKIGQSDLTATLKNGRLDAVLPKVNMYGGLGKMTAVVDAGGPVPVMALDLNLEDLSTNKFLSALAGFTRLTGEGFTILDVKGQGRSQAEIMKSLNGVGNFEVKNGVIAGIDVSQLMTGIDQALKSRTLPSGLGPSYSTKFKDLIAKFNIENGVVKINDFNLDAFGVGAYGGGQMDLGNQTVNFSFRPHATGASASNLAKFGIPIQFKGSFGNIKAGLDTDMLTKIAADRARAEVADQIKNNVGGVVGETIGNVITGTGGSSGATRPEDVVGGVVGGILGGQNGGTSDTPPANDNVPATEPAEPAKDTETPPKTAQEQLEDAATDAARDAISGLLGGKKKKAE